MVETISEEDVDRMDRHVDPTLLRGDQVESAFRSQRSDKDGSDLSSFVKGGARSAFAERIAEKRAPIRNSATEQLSGQISRAGNNGQRQLYGIDPETGRNTFVGTASNIEIEVSRDGAVYGTNQNTGTRAKVGTVDLTHS